MTTVTRPALLSCIAYLMQAAGLTLAELAQHQGQQPVQSHTVPRKPSPLKGQRQPLSIAAQRVVEMADNPEGLLVSELMQAMDISSATAYHHVKRLTDELHLLTCVPGDGPKVPHRYFARPAHAAAWLEANPRKPEPAAAPQEEPAPATERKDMPAPVTIAPREVGALAPGQPIQTEATRRVIDTTRRPNSRIEALPALPPDPRFPSFADEWKRLRGEASA